MFTSLRLSLVALALSTSAAVAHEFWIDPQDFTPDPGANIVADIRVGQSFNGSSYAYIPDNFRLFELAQGETRTPVEGRIGDRPALDAAPLGEGLNVILHVTRDYALTWKEWQKFADFVTHKDFDGVIEAHRAKGHPEKDFTEMYSRYGKSLVAVGEGAGQDRAYGLLTEIVALKNPYTDDLSSGLPVRVLYQDAPRKDVQVEIFAKAPDGSVTTTTTRTDDKGEATIPVTPGDTYLLDAVVMREPSAELAAKTGALWESLWASLTFRAPE
ncbi:DUF4198 domain-containing protein [Oceaniglobus roseus]|uniref:DUF4198 domain-containing protein n=1 Tax=Oceaniglobus roseus TaxID=1737570 RepID=UPI000C7EF521|nr:DUF4198 domain-containing protein [Kandeliimicrobium roseum]